MPNDSPVLHVVSAGGGAGSTTLVALLGRCASELDREALSRNRLDSESPWVLILATEGVDQAQRAVWLRDQALDHGWRVAAIATRGVEKRRPKAVEARFIPISEDGFDNGLVRVPHWQQAPRIPLAELPRWDFSRQDKKSKRQDGLPKNFACLFTQIMDYVAHEHAASRVFENAS